MRYGLRSMMEIAAAGEEGIFQKEIAKRQSISEKYLDTIIASLKTAGLIRNKSGKKSGYVLAKSPEQIRMLDIINAFQSGVCIIDCLEINSKCNRKQKCTAIKYWKELNNLIENYLASKTLKEMVAQLKIDLKTE